MEEVTMKAMLFSLGTIVALLLATPEMVEAKGKSGGNRGGARAAARSPRRAAPRRAPTTRRTPSAPRRTANARTTTARTAPRQVRDHRRANNRVVRDHRKPTAPVVRDHRKPTTPRVRDHRKPTAPRIRDHRKPRPLDPGIGKRPVPPRDPGKVRPPRNPKPRPKPFPKPQPKPFPKPLDPGIGNGHRPHHPGPIARPHHPHHSHRPWHKLKPRHCWWWFDYCRPLQTCLPRDYYHCDWNYVRCDYVVDGTYVQRNARWYLGVKGMILPGTGLGIEEVAAGSPADLAGLRPGLVILECNGIQLLDEQALAEVMKQSGGLLEMQLLDEEQGDQSAVTVKMRRLVTLSY